MTFVNRIHHVTYSYGWKLPFIDYGFFPDGHFPKYKAVIKKLGTDKNGMVNYHNCTLTGTY